MLRIARFYECKNGLTVIFTIDYTKFSLETTSKQFKIKKSKHRMIEEKTTLDHSDDQTFSTATKKALQYFLIFSDAVENEDRAFQPMTKIVHYDQNVGYAPTHAHKRSV